MPRIQSQNEHLLPALQLTHFIARHLLQQLNEIACQRRLEPARFITEVNVHAQQLLQILRQFRAAWQIQPLHEILRQRPAEVAAMRQHLAGYRIPAVIEVVAALPRSAVGKVLKSEARAQYQALLGSDGGQIGNVA